MPNPNPFQAFVEKVLLHYKLVDEHQLIQIRKNVAEQTDMDILDLLVASHTITKAQSQTIRDKYESLTPKQAPKPEPAEATQSVAIQTDIKSVDTHSVNVYIQAARELNASDLHLQIGMKPFVRRFGRLRPLNFPELEASSAHDMFFNLLNSDQKKQLETLQTVDFCVEVEGLRCRCCLVEQDGGLECTMRLVPEVVPSFEELGIPPEFLQLMEYKEGLVLITGPSGSGKSTTLAAVIDLINESRNEHIITLEEPIEYTFQSKRAHISQREVGLHTASYAASLRAALREDPDIIVVGELRDRETTSLAVTAAETGHLVFATLHTTSAAQTIYRLLDFFPPNQRNQIRAMVSESLHGILCQQLLPRKDGTGMALATELLFMVTSIANLVREDKLFQIPNMIQIGSKFGMHAMDDSLRKLVAGGIITEEDAYFAANKKNEFKNTHSQPANPNPLMSEEASDAGA